MADKWDVRNSLLELGVGDFNATMCIPMMFMAPRTTDPAMVEVIVVVRSIQEALAAMNAPNIRPTGVLDDATADALDQLMGPEWLMKPYYDTINAVVAAEKAGYTFMAPTPMRTGPEPVGGFFDFLPTVPGGLVTYGVGALLLWHFMKKKR